MRRLTRLATTYVGHARISPAWNLCRRVLLTDFVRIPVEQNAILRYVLVFREPVIRALYPDRGSRPDQLQFRAWRPLPGTRTIHGWPTVVGELSPATLDFCRW